jgi:hypothetical protein
VRLRVGRFPRILRPVGFLAHLRATWTEYPAFVALMGPTKLRRVGRTAGVGCLCLVPAEARTGDRLWLVRGGRVPLVLRPRGDVADDAWELVGEAYVHGIMYGEGFREEDCVDICIK